MDTNEGMESPNGAPRVACGRRDGRSSRRLGSASPAAVPFAAHSSTPRAGDRCRGSQWWRDARTRNWLQSRPPRSLHRRRWRGAADRQRGGRIPRRGRAVCTWGQRTLRDRHRGHRGVLAPTPDQELRPSAEPPRHGMEVFAAERAIDEEVIRQSIPRSWRSRRRLVSWRGCGSRGASDWRGGRHRRH